ncbi:MAG: Hsp20/alpha crystallin family protein [Usitatibacter sp.]
MSNIIRNDPVQDLTRAFEPLREFEAVFGWPKFRRWLSELPAEPTIKLDVTEDDKAFFVKAELPGVKKEDIAVEIDGNQVSITAETRREKEEKKGEIVVHSERYYGKQFRSFTLGREIDRKAAVAKFADGVLELTLPKNGTTPAQRLAIQ